MSRPSKADGVGFETIRYYLIINTIKDLYCAVLREIATTCNYSVTRSTPLISNLKSYQKCQAPSIKKPREAEASQGFL